MPTGHWQPWDTQASLGCHRPADPGPRLAQSDWQQRPGVALLRRGNAIVDINNASSLSQHISPQWLALPRGKICANHEIFVGLIAAAVPARGSAMGRKMPCRDTASRAPPVPSRHVATPRWRLPAPEPGNYVGARTRHPRRVVFTTDNSAARRDPPSSSRNFLPTRTQKSARGPPSNRHGQRDSVVNNKSNDLIGRNE